jgi:5-methyltetrahydrofolate--homocysteine methyltransferase
MNPMSQNMETIIQAVVEGKHTEIEKLVQQAVDDGIDLNRLINDALVAAMDIVGQKFSTGEIYVPEMLVSALTMKKGLTLIKPLLSGEQTETKGRILMGTVKGDLHDIGKNLVIMMLEGAGFEVVDLGVDLTVDKVVEEVEKQQPQILGLSALLTTTMPEMKAVIEALTEKGLRDQVKIMVGGAPVDASFAEKIGADGYGQDAAQAVKLAKNMAGLN